jgi:alpha-tubulin suppressor-like RCC1 family protein
MLRRCFRFVLAVWLLAAAGAPGAAQAQPEAPAAPALDSIAAISGGGAHTCAISNAGGAYCWGDNRGGQLGDGTHSERLAPVGVIGLASGVAEVAAGGASSCARLAGGGVKCWGDGSTGALGAGQALTRTTVPVDVSGLASGVAAITAGLRHACALTTGGGVKCWGDNYYGQLGNDHQYQNSFTPVDVVGLASGVTAIASAKNHTCAIVAGGLKCWGDNFWHQLGDGTNNFSHDVPRDVVGLASGVAGVTTGSDHTCALVTGGAVQCWGENSWGQLGAGHFADANTPISSTLTSGVLALEAGDYHTCARRTGGAVQCWGDNLYHQLGQGPGNVIHNPTPVEVVGLASGVTSVSAGANHTCALVGGTVHCWGYNGFGQLGNGIPDARPVPVAVLGLGSGQQGVAAGTEHACAFSAAGAVSCWGRNNGAQLGLDPAVTNLSATPLAVAGVTSQTIGLVAGLNHTCARMAPGGVKCWGAGGYGQLGNGTTPYLQPTPVNVTGLGAVDRLVAHGDNTCALTGGQVKCWGFAYGNVPSAVAGVPSGVLALALGDMHQCLVTAAGGVQCWGDNTYDQLGVGQSGGAYSSGTPVAVAGLNSGAIDVVAGTFHSCALMTGGSVKCWGLNAMGEVGDGTLTKRNAPADVIGLGGPVTTLLARGQQTCALLSGGAVQCWGEAVVNPLGQAAWSQTPKTVPGLESGVTSLAVGRQHKCAVVAGAARCWGSNYAGELGNGEASVVSSPITTAAPLVFLRLCLPLLIR